MANIRNEAWDNTYKTWQTAKNNKEILWKTLHTLI